MTHMHRGGCLSEAGVEIHSSVRTGPFPSFWRMMGHLVSEVHLVFWGNSVAMVVVMNLVAVGTVRNLVAVVT